MYVAEVQKGGAFVGKIAIFDIHAVQVDGSRISDGGTFRYVTFPDDCCPSELAELIWGEMQKDRRHGESGGYTWTLTG